MDAWEGNSHEKSAMFILIEQDPRSWEVDHRRRRVTYTGRVAEDKVDECSVPFDRQIYQCTLSFNVPPRVFYLSTTPGLGAATTSTRVGEGRVDVTITASPPYFFSCSLSSCFSRDPWVLPHGYYDGGLGNRGCGDRGREWWGCSGSRCGDRNINTRGVRGGRVDWTVS